MSLVARQIWSSISPEAKPLFERINAELFASAPAAGPAPYRRARLVALLCADALNGDRSGAARDLRWRRFVRALDLHAPAVHSESLDRILTENRDLLGGEVYLAAA